MVDHNYCEKVQEIKRQITTWLKRKLTPLGRVTIVKSLLVPKFNYLFLSLPEPNVQIMKDINRCFYEFVWSNKPDKISRKQMCQLYRDGGVKMTDIFLHTKSLKISWIRRFINDSLNDNFTLHMFQSFLPPSYPSLELFMGSEYYKRLANLMSNSFWKEVLLAFSDLTESTTENISCQPLWNNPRIKLNNDVIYVKSWCAKGIRFVNDILKTDGTFLSYFEVKHKFEVQINFLRYYGLCNSIRSGFNKSVIPKVMEPTCIIPETLLLILKRKKGCSHIYQSFLKYKIKDCKSLTKWKNDFDLDNIIWSSYCLIPFQSTVDINMRWFQLKILNRILYMKDALLKFKLVTDNLCTFCNNSKETIMHILCLCTHSDVIWSRLEQWLSRNNLHVKLTNRNKLFGFYGCNNSALNCILMIVRREIYSAKCKKQLPLFENIISAVKCYYDMEKYIAQTNLKETKFRKKWLLFAKCF